MAQEKKDTSLEERKVKALESIANTLEDLNDWVYSMETDVWSDRISFYLNEFYQLAKAKTVGPTNRPSRDAERENQSEETPIEGEE
jgi:hypothetical protein